MDQLWTPWRFSYVSQGTKDQGCVLCDKAAAPPSQDCENLVLYRAKLNLVILNLFPYTTGHSMIVPYAHAANLAGVSRETLAEMIDLARALQDALGRAYRPDGYNLGMNLGRVAGAGVADHLHLHVLPRWSGDTNFMTVVGETRIHPEELHTTYEKLAAVFHT